MYQCKKKLGLKIISVFIICMIFQGCAFPEYESRFEPLNEKPSISSEEAFNRCIPQAMLAGANARNALQQRINQRDNQVIGYNCSTQGTSYYGTYQGNTNCTPQTAGQSNNIFSPVLDNVNLNNVEHNTIDRVLRDCLATEGWQIVDYCVKNCEP